MAGTLRVPIGRVAVSFATRSGLIEQIPSHPQGRGDSREEERIEMGKLIASTQATVDGVIDPVGDWVQPDGDHGDYSFERQARSGGMVLGRKTYEGLAG
jgi:hypothetical protein